MEVMVENNGKVDDGKYLALDKEFTKKFGDQYYGYRDKKVFESVSRVSTDCISLDRVLGGGLPEGRIIEIFGNPSSSKTTICNYIVASYQKQGKSCFWIDAERAFDPDYARACGIDIDTLGMLKPMTANDALECVRMACMSGVIDLVILDSTAALVPQDEYEKDAGSGMIGSIARLMSQMLKQVANLADEKKCTVIFINQIRASNLTGYGPKTTTTGGNALEFYSSIRLQINRSGYIEEKGEKIGIEVNVQTVKNKTFTPFKNATINVYFPYEVDGNIVAGVDKVGDILDNAISMDIVEKAGAWLSFNGEKVQGKEKMRSLLLTNGALLSEMDKQVRDMTYG